MVIHVNHGVQVVEHAYLAQLVLPASVHVGSEEQDVKVRKKLYILYYYY